VIIKDSSETGPADLIETDQYPFCGFSRNP
ncbi:uncharacterized protein METZ01_LOCUS385535, partial [marine metagenome]